MTRPGLEDFMLNCFWQHSWHMEEFCLRYMEVGTTRNHGFKKCSSDKIDQGPVVCHTTQVFLPLPCPGVVQIFARHDDCDTLPISVDEWMNGLHSEQPTLKQ